MPADGTPNAARPRETAERPQPAAKDECLTWLSADKPRPKTLRTVFFQLATRPGLPILVARTNPLSPPLDAVPPETFVVACLKNKTNERRIGTRILCASDVGIFPFRTNGLPSAPRRHTVVVVVVEPHRRRRRHLVGNAGDGEDD